MDDYCTISKVDVLRKELEKYRNILSEYMYNYLDSLLSLDASALDETINENDAELLINLPFYKSIVKYNIYNHALRVLNSYNIKLYKKDDYKNHKLDMTSSLKLKAQRTINVLNLSINRNNSIELQLFNVLSDNIMKEKELLRLQKKIDNLNSFEKEKRLPRIDYFWVMGPLYQDNVYDTKYEQNLELYKKAIKKINMRNDITKNDQEEISTTCELYNLFLNEYGLKDEDFVYERTEYITGQSHKYMNKVKTKTKANVKVISNNYYL